MNTRTNEKENNEVADKIYENMNIDTNRDEENLK
jgi:hypothetical protein